MGQQDVEALAVKVGMFASNLKELSDRVVMESHQATQRMNQTAQSLALSAENAGKQAIERLQQTATGAIVAGAGAATNDIEQRLMACAGKVEHSTNQLDQRIRTLSIMHTANAWKAFIAAAVGSLAVIAVAVYVVWHAHRDLRRVQWVEQINAAEVAGKLAPCPDSGICVLVNKKWVRLDQ
ncbi:hypothetical protein EKH79_00385 [Dyella dinghuensis]|uniref:Relaxation protein n=1 Tax=Dyella dinghuensis TaxID=1920169 RepID=A0A3S0RW97_9GAMM|nr:hypothetical protein [Dyella dinghuensis]RUL67099.1 hypothetical protein EKH79_00385 [Dyella dinghuensis]